MVQVAPSLREASAPLINEVAKSPKLVIQPRLWQNCPIRPFSENLLVSPGPRVVPRLSGWTMNDSKAVTTHSPVQGALATLCDPIYTLINTSGRCPAILRAGELGGCVGPTSWSPMFWQLDEWRQEPRVTGVNSPSSPSWGNTRHSHVISNRAQVLATSAFSESLILVFSPS